ncbi:MAG: aminoacyl-histidine dipeptidase [Deferribacteres bacterium]|nr:aminoacyl-histidine dipeptidase [Deferribacteres bacterium]
MTFVSDLEPKVLWRYFDTILTIPRGSKKEDQMREFVVGEAKKHGLEYKTDAIGNVVVRKPGTPGHEKAPITILQAHLDMVNEKNSDVDHDFDKDPIKPQIDGDYLKATGTTLGSDNGIGVAAMLALIEDKNVEHGPLELLFTIDEETGLTGAGELGPGMVEGKRLLNLDTEEEGIFYIGCAGGADSNFSLPLTTTGVPSGSAAVQAKLFGLKGGHSGCDIHLQRGNATKLLVRALQKVQKSVPFNIAHIQGGNLHNAIPREAFVTVVLASAKKDDFVKKLKAEMATIHDEFRPAEPDMKLDVNAAGATKEMLDDATTAKVMNLITGLPHGVLSMSYDIPELVETSTNLAAVKQENGELKVLMSSRSSVDSAIHATRRRIRSIAELAGASVEEGNGYPGWKPDVHSPLLALMKDVHKKVTGHEPEVKAVHAGLECGIIGEKYPGMDMISIGPQIEFPHSPDERVKIHTVKDFYDLLVVALKELAK